MAKKTKLERQLTAALTRALEPETRISNPRHRLLFAAGYLSRDFPELSNLLEQVAKCGEDE